MRKEELEGGTTPLRTPITRDVVDHQDSMEHLKQGPARKGARMDISPGLTAERRQVVTPEQTAEHLGSGSASVFSTPSMVLLMELTALAAVDPHLPEGQQTVGIGLSVRHLAPTPVGMQVRCRAELQEVNGRRLIFHVQVWDEVELIGEGTHERAIVEARRFLERAEQKGARE
ncbi:MAG: hypothetical protein KatS3mg057_0299 [Herpetosiphonaceae bacterium]|nr:MAG: hypothetical protein KatS3mg057_0299 [Herpetosiphonaceae bacterium]